MPGGSNGSGAPAVAAPVPDDAVPGAGATGPAARAAPVPIGSGLTVDAGLLLGQPAALETGMTSGVVAGIATGGAFAAGLRGSWSTATEYTRTWHVTQQELRLRLVGIVQQPLGRGRVGLRLGLGGTEVYESRLRDQAARLGLTGSELETTAWQLLPAAELEAQVTLLVFDRFGVAVGGGPSAVLLAGALQAGFVGSVGVTWFP